MTYNSHKANIWYNNHSHKCFVENQLSKTTLFIRSRQTIVYQLSNCHSPQYINYHCKKNLFYCCYLCVLDSTLTLLHKAIVCNPVFIPLSNKGYQYACVCTLMVIKRWWQKLAEQPTFGPLSYITCFYIELQSHSLV